MVKKLNILFLLFTILFFAFQTISIPVEKEQTKAKQLWEEVLALKEAENYQLALNKALQVKDIYIKQQQWEKAVDALIKAAYCTDWLPTSDLEQKEKYVKEAMTLATKHLPTNHQTVAKIQQYQGELFFENGQLDSAIIYFERAAQLYDQHKIWEDKAWTVFTLGIVYQVKEEYDKMEEYLLKTKAIAQSQNLSEEFYSAVNEALSMLYYSTLGDYEKAIQLTTQSLNFYLSKPKKKHQDSMFIHNNYRNLGVYYFAKKDFNRAGTFYEKAFLLSKRLKLNALETGDVAIRYANILSILDQPKLATHILKEALQIDSNQFRDKEIKKLKSEAYFNLSKNYRKLEQLDSAVYFIEKSVAIAKNQLQIRASLEAADLFYKKGEKEKALNTLNALNLESSTSELYTYLNKHKTYNIYGKIYTDSKEYDTALQYFQKAIAANCSSFSDTLDLYALPTDAVPLRAEGLIVTLQNKSLTLKAINTPKSLKAAFETNQLAIKWAEKTRQDFAFDESKLSLNQYTKVLYKDAIEIAHQLYQSTTNPTYLEAAFAITEKQKSILLLESLVDEKGKQYYDVPKELLERERQLKLDIAFYRQKMLDYNGKDSAKYERYSQYHNDKNIEFAYVKDTLSDFYQSYFELEYQESIASIDKIQEELLSREQAFIQYVAIDSLFYVFAIEKDQQHFFTLPKGEKEMAALQEVQTLLHSVNEVKENDVRTFQNYTASAYQSYQNILEPITAQLSPTTKELIIIPDDVLNYLPFEALINEEVATTEADFLGLPYLIHDYQFHYGYSGSLLLKNKEQYDNFNGNDKILAYAPPYKSGNLEEEEETALFAQRGSLESLRGGTVRLGGTAKEIQAISTHFGGAYVSDNTATKANFQEQVKDYGILHLAMHGVPNYEEPDYAHLIFSNLSENTDTLLHHYEISALETNAQLAVLSACETGVGKNLAGEGVMSLGRAFMYAGVPSVVMSLWKMNDQSTSELMPLFYENLADGMRKDKALHQAKIDYLNNAIPERAYPFYWAGFVSLGDAQPIQKGRSNMIWWIGGVLGLVLMGGFFWRRKR